MAFPTPATPVATPFASSVTSMPVSMPATVNSGDLLISLVEVRNAGTWSTVPTGWNTIATVSQTGGGSVGKLDGFYKIAVGTEAGTTPTWIASTGTTAEWQVIRVTTWDGTTAPQGATASGDATAANPPSLSPLWGSADNLWIAVAGHAAISAAAFTAGPSGFSGFQNNGASSGGSAVSLASATLQFTSATEDPGTFTAGGSNRFWAAATIAIKPSGASPVVNSGFFQLL